MKIKQISPQKNDFTKVLEDIAVMPKILYYYGEWPEKREKTVAIVGSRRSTKYGDDIAYKLGYELGKRGIIVVSGLAYGIDSVAARGALDGGGKTIAILGTEIGNIYPKRHESLAKKIVEKGGVVASEYENGAKLDPKWSFLQRNRIISGLADAVVVVEAAERSGSLNTAAHALVQGKDLFAVPGDLGKNMSKGCNRLIQKGANVFLGVDEFLRYLIPVESEKRGKRKGEQISLFGDTPEETAILKLMEEGIKDGDLMMEKLEMSMAEFNQAVTMLELKNVIKPLGANHWILA